MHDISVIEKLASTTDSRIIQIILDGVGDIYNNNTPSPLEKAQTPNLDKLARASSLGLADPIFPGITPGSGPGHLSLFGYDPLKFNIGRGVLEALGIDLKLRDNGM
ncbi:phosphoglycerate mutase, partial [bacterium]|nr:phosphoglycerate mutase [bacterium]